MLYLIINLDDDKRVAATKHPDRLQVLCLNDLENDIHVVVLGREPTGTIYGLVHFTLGVVCLFK